MGIYEIENDMISGYRARENASIAFSMTRIPNSPYISYLTPQKQEMHELRKTLEIDIKPALQNGDYFIKLQPRVNLNNYTLVGAEALSRWKRNGEYLPPLSFIPHFEQNGMIVDIDFFVLDSVCKLIREWLDKGLNVVPISVNFSKITLESYDYLNNVLAIIEKYNIPPKYIEIEFTETCCMENEIKIKELLNNIKEHGIKASLDDFGTGYSSINMLKNMNFNMLKLDKSFLSENKEDEEREKIILTNIIKMAKSLSLEIVSEGVETIEQADYLKYLKCDYAQGYLFDRPLSVEDFEKRLISPIYDI
jgi:EAL domain-containing protein (putative c-di-GMP-specific phosphodiesterase class I)